MNPTSHDPSACDIDALNSLLRNELSAVATYTQAIGKFEDQQVINDLQKIREDHVRAERELRERVVELGGTPVEGGEPWSAFAAAVAGTTGAVAPTTALSALCQGEEHGVEEYEAVLEKEELDPDCGRLIRRDVLPAYHRHAEELNRLLGGMSCG